MVGTAHRTIWVMAALCVLLCGRIGFADDSPSVHVKFAKGATELVTLKDGTKLFSNREYTFVEVPAEINGLIFTRRAGGEAADVTLDIPAGGQVYLLVDSDRGHEAKQKGGPELNRTLAASGWTRLANIKTSNVKGSEALYTQTFNDPIKLSLHAGGFSGIIVAAKSIAMDADNNAAANKPDEPASGSAHQTDATRDAKPTAGPTTRIANPQATIKTLEILEMGSGLMLGQTSEAVLTVTPGNSSKQVSVRFVTQVGNEMTLARDEALRFIHVKYPNWYADDAEITFQDKYNAHDGGSIGVAIATMVLSTIQGFTIDPDIALTGDISANGKVRAIGGVSAKIRGAIDSKCALVAIPMDNQDQLVDAVTYSGPAMLSEIQVIGISDVDDAIATMRTDRDNKLTQAIATFSAIQSSIKNDPAYLKKPEAKEKLDQVLALAPQHLSARVLLDVVTGKQPKTLSVTASFYYTSLAVRNMLEVLNQRDKWKNPQLVPSSVVRIGLSDLRKLMPLADPNVRPLITAWMQFIQAWSELQEGEGSTRELQTRAQAVTDEMTKEDTNADLMQQTLKEGF